MSRLSSKAALFTAAATLALVAAAPALAQDDDVQEVIVTIQKREQAITEVPAAFTAYGGDYLQDIGVTDFEQLSAFVPGFEVQNQSANNPGFVMRGITSDALEAYNEPRVSVFQDGVSISRSSGAFVELYDLQCVEVAKGPQSTLFGRGALIVAVNVSSTTASTVAAPRSAPHPSARARTSASA